MSMSWPTYGLGNVASYQASTMPFLTSSLHITGSVPLEVKFPAVTKFITVTNTLPGSATNVPLRVGFSSNGVQGVTTANYLVLNNNESYEGNLSVTSVFLLTDSTLACSGSVVAGMTNILPERLADNWSGSSGIG